MRILYSKTFKWLELIVIFIFVPVIINHFRSEIKYFIILITALCFLYCFSVLYFDTTFDRKQFAYGAERYNILKIIGLRFVFAAPLLAIFVIVFFPEKLFTYPFSSIWRFLVFILCYPLFSVYPQEIIFRTFVFHRYRHFFKNRSFIIIFSSLIFGFAHIIYGNWIAVIFSTIAGYVFASTYAESESTVIVSVEHALWGDFIFIIGLGSYFYSGAIS